MTTLLAPSRPAETRRQVEARYPDVSPFAIFKTDAQRRGLSEANRHAPPLPLVHLDQIARNVPSLEVTA